MKWVLGCGLGCIVLIILAVVAVSALIYWGVTEGTPMAAKQHYGELKKQGIVPEADQPIFDRLVELGTGENASMYATLMALGVVKGTLSDGAVSDEERIAVNELIEMLEANPDISAAQLQEFQSKYPGIIQGQPGMFGMPAPPTAAEPPVAPAEPEAVTPPAAETPEEVTPPAAAPMAEPPAEGAAPTE
jgi:hypothetical protein